jgi:hypothetical protein
MSARRLLLLAAALCLGAAAISPAAAAAAAPGWSLTATPMPANLAPGGEGEYFLVATNDGGAVTSGAETTLSLELPGALEVKGIDPFNTDKTSSAPPSCAVSGSDVSCETAEPVHPGGSLFVQVRVAVPPLQPPGELEAKAAIAGGGAPAGADAVARVPVQSEPAPFDFLGGFAAPATSEEGTAENLAGAHPFQQTISFGFPTKITGEGLTNDGHPRDVSVELPRGWVGNPAATPVLCTEAELVSAAGCPDPSQVGLADITSLLGKTGTTILLRSPFYNMAPPPGYPAELATDVGSVGIYLHVLVRVRSEGDYGIEATTPDIIAFGQQPIFAFQAQLWGDPSSPTHDLVRGNCTGPTLISCPVAAFKTAFLTLPGECSGRPLGYGVLADSWEEPAPAFPSRQASYESADAEGNPASISGCNQVEFQPTLQATPTTDLVDSPSGLEVDLHQPQDTELGHRSTAALKDATVTLPAGMAVNPSQADGLGVCSSVQAGLATPVGATPVHFSAGPAACPDAAKIGTVEVATPLLVRRDAEQKLELDPETHRALPEPLHGSVYLAKPFDNPFGSLLAVYLSIDDPRTGTVATLAGRIEPDPRTGQLTTVFSENPELPIEDIRLHLFGGARGALITPPTCGAHTTTTDLVPWTSPEGADAHPDSSFQITAMPGGGACPADPAQAPDAPAFDAGTLSPQAGAFSPFVLKISREDGSQRIAAIDTTLAPGLIGKLAGIDECSETQIARAASRSNPEEGISEREDSSCPASSQVGVVNVGAGAGPTPIYTQGKAYLAGPYKGAPLSLAIVTPAIAGPFDLGTVVVRTALYVDPFTAQIHAVSDPFPQILDGIPLDIRSVALRMDRPDFTLNPTSCDPLAITGTATSALGQGAPLTRRFPVDGCSSLPFKPKLSLRLKGKVGRTAHPTLVANLAARPGEANIASAQVKLPKSAFLDQGHIRTVCTRVQWAADTCPPGSVYGRATATSPLVGYPLTGAVYLRSSDHPLPDLAVKLKGPVFQPIEIDLLGRTDSVKGALRNSFEAVPDAPVSRFHLELFGGGRGLVEMSEGFCGARRATVNLTGQNGKVYDTRPVVAAKCPKRKRHGHRKSHGGHGHGKGGKR